MAGRILYANDACSSISGYAVTELLALPSLYEIVAPEERETLLERLCRSPDSQTVEERLETTIVHKSGRRLDLEVTAKPLQGSAWHVITLHNITGGKGHEECIRFQARLLQEVGRAVVAVDMEERITYWNRAAEALYGWSAEEVVGQPISEVLVTEAQHELAAEVMAELRAGGSWSGEFVGKRRDGTSFLVAVTDTPVRDEHGDIVGIVGVSADITERKRSEYLLRQQSAAMRASMDGVAILDENGSYFYMNDAHAEIFGYGDPAELVGKTWRVLYDGDELTRLERDIELVLREHGRWRGEAIGKRRDGSTFPQEVSLAAIEGGGTVCVVRDITERKKSEEDLRRSEERFRSVFEDAPIGVALVGLDRRYLRVNRQLCEMLGYPEENLLAMTSSEVTHPDDLEISAARMRQVVGGEPGSHALEKRYVRADGRVVWVLSSVSMVETVGGEPGYFVVLYQDITERKALEEKLARQAYYDVLTGLPNRTLFMDRLQQALARMDRHEAPIAVLFLDLDNFKLTNDSLGHEAGDEMLAEVARRLTDCVRPHDTVARLGGDEFTALLEGVEDRNDAIRVAERIGEALRRPFHLGKHRLVVSCSVGIVLDATAEDLPEDLLRRADLALYKAKRAGKDRYEVFEADSASRLRRGRGLEAELKLALERDEFVVLYQPTMHLRTGEIVGMEASLRWEHPKRGTLEAKEFLAVAEETNLIIPVGEGVIREACRQGAVWQRRYPERLAPRMSVNVSRKQLADETIVEKVAEILRETGMSSGKLWIDVTGVTVMEDEEIIGRLLALRDLGIHIAVDNSSLSQLRRLPADTTKIGRALISTLDENPQDRAIAAVIDLARALGCTTIACGVETAEQFTHLKRLGCDLAQGTYFSKPLPASVATPLLDAELGKPATVVE